MSYHFPICVVTDPIYTKEMYLSLFFSIFLPVVASYLLLSVCLAAPCVTTSAYLDHNEGSISQVACHVTKYWKTFQYQLEILQPRHSCWIHLPLSLSPPLVKDNIFWICHFRGIFWDKLDTDYKLPAFCESKRLKLPNLGGDPTLN